MRHSRELWIDSLRGFSMLGIMIVNFPSINTIAGNETTEFGFVRSSLDQSIANFIMLIFNSKMYPIFATLFGLGTYIFMKGAERNKFNPFTLILRRLSFLFFLGMLHLSFVWWGDILFVYSILGFLLIGFYGKSPDTIIKTSLFLLAGIPVLSLFVLQAVNFYYGGDLSFALASPKEAQQSVEAITQIYRSGSLVSITYQRIHDYIVDFTPFLKSHISLSEGLSEMGYYCQLAGLFLFGFWFADRKHYKTLGSHLNRVKTTFFFSASIALGLTLLSQSFKAFESLHFLTGTLQSLCYVTGFILAFHTAVGQTLLTAFSPVGRMSLTAYLMHTLFFTSLLYGYGAGLYGKIGPSWTFGITLVFYGAVCLFCHTWLRYFTFGPAEWIWRKATYGGVTPQSSTEGLVINS